MKKYPFSYRIMLIGALLLGTVGSLRADVTNPSVPDRPPGSRIERDPGVLSRLFGRISNRVRGTSQDDDDVDDDRRSRPRNPQSQSAPPAPGTTVITTTTTTTTNRAPIRSEHPGAKRSSRVQEDSRREVQPLAVPTRIVVVPATPPDSSQIAVAPSGSTTFAPTDVHGEPLPFQVPPEAAQAQSQPAFHPGIADSLRTPELNPVSSSSFAEQAAADAAITSSAEQPGPPPLPPFGRPVPGRRGLVYLPGHEATQENMIDVTDIPPGTKVRDPVSKTVFRVP